jgi:probable rRNA maturation factor
LDIGVQVAAAWRRAVPGAARYAKRAAEAAFAVARDARLRRGTRIEAAVVLASDARMCALNLRYRRRDKPTNVLAFAAREGRTVSRAAAQPLALGDVIVAFETVRAEARAEGKPLADHLRHLVVHGVLHLLGHDHRRARDARRMERLEIKALGRLDVPNPYAPRIARPRGRLLR